MARALLPRGTAHLLPLRPRSGHIRCTSSSSSAPPPPLLPPLRSKVLPRRSVSATLLLLHCLSPYPNRAIAGGLFDKYVKRKKLEPLDSYVPAVLLAQSQFKDLEKMFDTEQPDYDITRSLLRSGPAASLRVNIRAVAQYASEDGKGRSASDAVDKCLRALEDLDSLLLHASRKDSSATIELMRNKISIAMEGLDRF